MQHFLRCTFPRSSIASLYLYHYFPFNHARLLGKHNRPWGIFYNLCDGQSKFNPAHSRTCARILTDAGRCKFYTNTPSNCSGLLRAALCREVGRNKLGFRDDRMLISSRKATDGGMLRTGNPPFIIPGRQHPCALGRKGLCWHMVFWKVTIRRIKPKYRKARCYK